MHLLERRWEGKTGKSETLEVKVLSYKEMVSEDGEGNIRRVLIKEGKKVFSLLKNNISKVSYNNKLTVVTCFIIFAPGHKVSYYFCTSKQSFIIFAQNEIVNYHISAFALFYFMFFCLFFLVEMRLTDM